MGRIEKDAEIIFWGTPEFAIPVFEALVKNGYSIVAVVTNPDEPKGRKQILTPPPVKVYAEKYGIPVFQPPSLKIENWKLKIPDADLYIVAAYNKIIPQDILDRPKLGALGIHPSLLPHWRGPSPIQHAILKGDTETGVTIFKVDEKMDHGPILANSKFKIQNSKIRYKELHDILAKVGAELLISTLPKWINGKIKPVPQDETLATYSKILKKEDGRIVWAKPASAIERQVRAFEEWPGSYTFWQKNGHSLRLEIEEAEAITQEKPYGTADLVWQHDVDSLLVQTGSGSVKVFKLHPEGRKSMGVRAFLNGHSDIIGATLK